MVPAGFRKPYSKIAISLFHLNISCFPFLKYYPMRSFIPRIKSQLQVSITVHWILTLSTQLSPYHVHVACNNSGPVAYINGTCFWKSALFL